MGGTKTKGTGRGPDKKKRKSRASKAKSTDEPKKNIIRDIIDSVSEKIKGKKEEEPWELDFGPHVKSMVLGRHVFKREDVVEIDLGEL